MHKIRVMSYNIHSSKDDLTALAAVVRGEAPDVVLVQEASSLDPAENRDRLSALVPDDADLVVFPEASARDFGEPGSDLGAVAEPLDGPFVAEVERVAAERGTTVVAGLFERGEGTPYNTVVVRGGARADARTVSGAGVVSAGAGSSPAPAPR